MRKSKGTCFSWFTTAANMDVSAFPQTYQLHLPQSEIKLLLRWFCSPKEDAHSLVKKGIIKRNKPACDMIWSSVCQRGRGKCTSKLRQTEFQHAENKIPIFTHTHTHTHFLMRNSFLEEKTLTYTLLGFAEGLTGRRMQNLSYAGAPLLGIFFPTLVMNTLLDILVTSFPKKQFGAVILIGQVSCNESLSLAQMGPHFTHMHSFFHFLRLHEGRSKQLWPVISPALNNRVAINKWTSFFSLNMQLHEIDYRSDKTQNNCTNTELGSDFYQHEIKVV